MAEESPEQVLATLRAALPELRRALTTLAGVSGAVDQVHAAMAHFTETVGAQLTAIEQRLERLEAVAGS